MRRKAHDTLLVGFYSTQSRVFARSFRLGVEFGVAGAHGFGFGVFIREFSFFDTEFVHFIPVEQLDEAIAKVERHRLDMLIDFSNPMRYWINSTSTNGYFLEKLLLASRVQSDSIAELAGAFNVIDIPEKQTVIGSEIRYVDWVLPGVLAVNMMFSCLFGIGYVIVRYRKNRVLRRLKATPLLPFEFLAAQVLSRLLIIMVITVIVYIACDLFIDFYIYY